MQIRVSVNEIDDKIHDNNLLDVLTYTRKACTIQSNRLLEVLILILTLWLVFVLWALKYYRPTKRKAPKRKAAQRLVCQPSQAEVRRLEKAEQDRQLAAADIDRCQAQKETLMRLLDSIETELQTTADQKRITTLLTKQASVENRLYNLDRRLDKAWATARR